MRTALFAALVLLAACGSKKTGDSTGSGSSAGSDTGSSMVAGSGSGSGSSMAAGSGSGSSMAAGSGSGSGSADAGSGSAAAGSGSGSSAAAGSGSGSGSGSSAMANVPAPDKPFDKMNHDEKLALMKKTVLPAMREAFHNFDAKKYEKVNCKTCHGKDPEGSKYKMPNPDLPQLDFAALKAGKQKPETAKFMGEVVNPMMAKMLGEPEYSEQNKDGFGCLECHTQKK